MADERWIEIELEDEDDIMARFDLFIERRRVGLKDLLDEIGDYAVYVIRSNVPRYRGYTSQHVDRTGISWVPGGAGGGGDYQVVAGIKAGRSRHPIYVEIGTGLYGKFARLIVPLRAQFMIFFGTRAGRVLAKRTVKGQKPQRYFYKSWKEIEIYARGRLMAADLS